MNRIAELVERRHLQEAVAAVEQDARVARKRGGIAGYGDDRRSCAARKHARLRLRALPGRIEDHGIERVELLGP